MIVEVQQGKLEGVQKKSVLTGRPYYAFSGIPFAEPPTGDLRFKAPVPIGKWEGIRDCSQEGSECFQVHGVPVDQPKIIGSEDCLYLNVYTPEAPSAVNEKKAVMVYIHGGAFNIDSGTARIYGPDYLMGHDIIYVALNYRLNVFGFLNTNTVNCPGNAGLKDQLLALGWVRENIASFGGDPENITIFGQNAGAESVHLHMLSPLSRGLFKRAILQSGTALSPWLIQNEPEIRARKFGQLAGYPGQDLEGLVVYLKNIPGQELCELANKFFLHNIQNASAVASSPLVFIPSVEKIKDDAFLPDFPENLIKTASPIPSIAGFTDQEGLVLFLYKQPERIHSLLNDLTVVMSNCNLGESQRAEMMVEINQFYFQDKQLTTDCKTQLVDFYSDLYYMKFYDTVNHLIASGAPPYVYLFAHDGKLNFLKNYVTGKIHPDLNITGASHGDDLGYLFSQSRFSSEMDDSDIDVINHFCTLWTNFAKNGEPTSSVPNVNWRPHTIGQPCHIKIKETLETFDKKLHEERLCFWGKWSAYFYR